jgi:hypothetical protein
MHTFAKQLLSLAFVFVLMAGTAVAQNNTATIKQGEDYQTGAVVDGGDNVFLKQVGGSVATITQGRGGNDVTGVNGEFTQQGRSSLTVRQDYGFGQGNDVRGEQLGSQHEATITQHNSGLARFEQRGHRNDLILQQYNGDRNRFTADQNGNRNYIQFIQRGSVLGSNANILQRGNRNVVDGLREVSSSPFLTGLGLTGLDSRAEQQSGDQTLVLEQRGGHNHFYVSQDGGAMDGMNTIRMEQKDGAYAEVLQSGGQNLIRGERGSMALSNKSDLFVSQQGEMNTLRFDQTTTGNTLTVTQFGDMNTTKVQQN